MHTPDKRIWVTAIKNPFDPHRTKDQQWFDHTPGMTAHDAVKSFYPLVGDDLDYEVSVNGKLLATDDIKGHTIKPNDNVVFCTVPHGGDGGGAKMLRTVAMIAVMVVATYVSGGAGGAAIFAKGGALYAGGSGAAIAGAAVAIGGAMLVNAVLPVPTPDTQAIGGDLEKLSPTYAFGAQPNVYLEGSRWPVLYGTRKITPPILAKHITQYNVGATIYSTGTATVTDGSVTVTGAGTSWTSSMVGGIFQITDPTDPEAFKRYFVATVGSSTALTLTEEYAGSNNSGSTYRLTYEEEAGITQQRIHILMAVADHAVDSITDVEINGSPIANFEGASYETKLGDLDQTVLYDFRSQRQQTSVSQEIDVDNEYTGQTIGDAITAIEVGLLLPAGLYWVNDTGSLQPATYSWALSYRVTGAPGWTTWKTITLQEKTRRAVRAYAVKTGLPAEQYDIKVEVTRAPPDNQRYSPYSSYVEYIGELIQEDFSYPGASLLAVRALATGQLSGSQPTITCTATRSTVDTSAGTKPANLPAWAAYDLHCNPEYGERISYSEMDYADFNSWASFCSTNDLYCNIYIDNKMSLTEACAHFEQIGRGKVVERGTTYSCLIDTTGSPVQLFNIGNIVEDSFSMGYIDYANQANIVQVGFWDADNDEIKRIAQVTKPGFDPSTDEANITQVSLYGCTDSDIALKHATYLLNGNTLQIRSVSFEAGFDSIACQAGDVIRVSYDAINWGQGGRVISSTALSTTVDRTITLLTGTTYYAVVQHQDDDDIEQVELTAVGEDTTSATFAIEAPGWTATPAADAVISIGTTSTITKSFRVTSITRASDQRRKIQALEYNADVYDDTVTAEDFVEIDIPDIVTGLAARQITERLDGQYKTSVNLSWRGVGFKFRVYYRLHDDTNWILAGTTTAYEFAVEGLADGKSYDFAVTDMWRGPDYYATVEDITVTGWKEPELPIYVVSGLQIIESGNGSLWYGRDLSLDWNTTSELWTEGVDEEPGGVGTFPTVEATLVYRVRIVNTDGTLRRERIIKESSYIYTYEDNYADGSGTPAASLTVMVWARNHAGGESTAPAMLYVTNPAPAAPTGVQAAAYMGGVKCYWNANTDPDLRGYKVRYKIAASDWTPDWTGITWQDIDTTEFVLSLSNAQRLADTLSAYFQVQARDTFGNVSSTVEADATADDFFIVEGALSTALQTKITDAEEITSQVELLSNQWTVKVQEDDYITGMGIILNEVWSATTSYSTGDYVAISTGAVYIAIAPSLNQEPSASPSYWTVVPNGARSEAIFLVDKFAIVNPSSGDGVTRAPFVVGAIGGVSTVGINGALMVDGTITAEAIETGTLTADLIKGTDFGELVISSGKITINTEDGLYINTGGTMSVDGAVDILGGADLFLTTDGSDASYATWRQESTNYVKIGGTGWGSFYIMPQLFSQWLYIGQTGGGADDWERVVISSTDRTTFYGDVEVIGDLTPYNYAPAEYDIGTGDYRWYEIFSHSVLNTADLFYMDTRIDEEGNIIEVDDEAVIEGIQPSNEYDPITGLQKISDSSLPVWLVAKRKESGEIRDDEGSIIRTWEAGDVMYGPDGKPYLSNMVMTSLLMGHCRKLSQRSRTAQAHIETLESQVITLHQRVTALEG